MTQTEALKLAIEGLEKIASSDYRGNRSSESVIAFKTLTAIEEALAQPKQLEGLKLIHKADIDLAKKRSLEAQPEQEQVTALYIYRQPDGSTQVMAPTINDPSLVIDMLEEGIRAMAEGKPVTRN